LSFVWPKKEQKINSFFFLGKLKIIDYLINSHLINQQLLKYNKKIGKFSPLSINNNSDDDNDARFKFFKKKNKCLVY